MPDFDEGKQAVDEVSEDVCQRMTCYLPVGSEMLKVRQRYHLRIGCTDCQGAAKGRIGEALASFLFIIFKNSIRPVRR